MKRKRRKDKEEELKADENKMEKWDEAEKIGKGNWGRAETEDRGKRVNKKEKNKVKENNKKMREIKKKYRRKETFCFVAAVRLLSMTLAW